MINSISRLTIEKNIHWVKKRCIVSFCSITAITRCELRLAAKLRNQTIIAEVGLAKTFAKSRGEKRLTSKPMPKGHLLHYCAAVSNADDCGADRSEVI